MLDVPARLDELARKPIEQLRMRRRFALHAEVLVVLTSPTPKYCCQNLLTVTRAVNGCEGSSSHFARPRRLVGASFGNRGKMAGTPGPTLSAGLSYSPRISTNVSRGFSMSLATI